MELGVLLAHSQESTTCPYTNQINPFLCTFTLLTCAVSFHPDQAKDLSASRYILIFCYVIFECSVQSVLNCLATVKAVYDTPQRCDRYKVRPVTGTHSLLLAVYSCNSHTYYTFPFRTDGVSPQGEEIKNLKNIISLREDIISDQENRKRKLNVSI